MSCCIVDLSGGVYLAQGRIRLHCGELGSSCQSKGACWYPMVQLLGQPYLQVGPAAPKPDAIGT